MKKNYPFKNPINAFQIGCISLILLTITAMNTMAQRPGNCGTDLHMETLKLEFPEIIKEQDKLETFTQEFVQNRQGKSTPTYVIPVVVHIFHNYGSSNIPDANVHDMLRIVNEDFQAKQPDTGNIVAAFQPIIGGLDIEFRLATKDPNGNCTNGINRVYDPVYTMQGGFINGNQGPAAPVQWPRDKYVNIWVVQLIDVNGQFLGYSSFPTSPISRDGVTIQNNVFGSLATSSTNNFNARYMSHELGHTFNLFHVWGNGGANGSPGNCNFDDNVGDTPNTIGTQSCNTNFMSCGSLDNVQNLMDYSYGSCNGLMFTLGQIARMEATLNSATGGRSNLWSPANLIATGTDDSSYANPPLCAPIAEFTPANPILTCQGATVNFRERSYNGTKDSTWTYQWSFPGATPNTSTDAQPQVVYTTSGKHDVTLTVSNLAGSSQPITKTELVEVLPGSGTFTAPYVERASDPSWPNNADPTLVWTVEKVPGSFFQFSRATNAFYSPPSSIFLNNFNFNGAGTHSLESPPMNLTALQSGAAFVNFQVAYSKKGNENETIFLYMSDDCGQSFSLVKFWLSNNFVSPNSPNTGSFIPADTSEWRFLSQDISSYAGKDGVIMRFEFQSSGGNNIYFDDIAVSDVSSPATGFEISLGAEFNLYPNPNKGVFNLDFYWDGSEEIQATLIDLVGKSTDISLGSANTGWNSMEVDLRQYQLKSGLYLLRMSSGKSVFTKQVIIE